MTTTPTKRLLNRWLPAAAALTALAAPALADPCGLVPPTGIPGPIAETLTRTGVQYTYVFYKDGVQDVVLRPAFKGKVSEFGMLIPFKTPPAVRKVSDEIFGQLEAAVKPPQIRHSLNPPRGPMGPSGPTSGAAPTRASKGGAAQEKLSFDTVRVVSQEAMGMYQVAVLEAGSAKALEKWMTDHGYVYPKGMEGVVNEYVMKRWCFVAVKARVGQKAGVTPRPGMRTTSPALPKGAVFKGAVQAMGFRFRTDTPVVPMRLSAHNPGKLHNRVFVLAEKGVRFEQLERGFVKQQIAGPKLVDHVTKALPCLLTYWPETPDENGAVPPQWGRQQTINLAQGEEPDLPATVVKRYQAWAKRGRDPYVVSGAARDLFLSDLLSAGSGRLLHHFEARHKKLTNISVALGQRGPHSDQIVAHALAEVRNRALAGMTEELAKMTLTVIEGEFPRETLAKSDLTLLCFDPATGTDSPGPRAGDGAAEAKPDGAANGGGNVDNDPMRTLWDRKAKIETRGSALVAILERGDGSDWARLRRVVRDAQEQPLLRFWAVGAMGKMRPPETVSFLLAGAAGGPRTKEAWWWSSQSMQQTQPELHRAVTGYLKTDIGERAPQHLITVLLQGDNDNLRRAAASYFSDTPGARAALAGAIAFDAQRAKDAGVPWKGGALFIPGISFTTGEATGMTASLIHWMLHVEKHPASGGPNGLRVLQNNIFSLGRRYRVMSVNWRSSAAQMAVAWSQRWAREEGHGLQAAELLVHAYEVGGPQKAEIRKEMARLAGRDRGPLADGWRKWLEEIRRKQK